MIDMRLPGRRGPWQAHRRARAKGLRPLRHSGDPPARSRDRRAPARSWAVSSGPARTPKRPPWQRGRGRLEVHHRHERGVLAGRGPGGRHRTRRRAVRELGRIRPPRSPAVGPDSRCAAASCACSSTSSRRSATQNKPLHDGRARGAAESHRHALRPHGDRAPARGAPGRRATATCAASAWWCPCPNSRSAWCSPRTCAPTSGLKLLARDTRLTLATLEVIRRRHAAEPHRRAARRSRRDRSDRGAAGRAAVNPARNAESAGSRRR